MRKKIYYIVMSVIGITMFVSCDGGDRHDTVSYESFWADRKKENDDAWAKKRTEDSINWRKKYSEELDSYEASRNKLETDSIYSHGVLDNMIDEVNKTANYELYSLLSSSCCSSIINNRSKDYEDELNDEFQNLVSSFDSLLTDRREKMRERIKNVRKWYSSSKSYLDKSAQATWYLKNEHERWTQNEHFSLLLSEKYNEWENDVREYINSSESRAESDLYQVINNYYDNDTLFTLYHPRAKMILQKNETAIIDAYCKNLSYVIDSIKKIDQWYDKYYQKEATWYKKWNDTHIAKLADDARKKQLCDDSISLFEAEVDSLFGKDRFSKCIFMRKGDVGRVNYDCPYYYVVDSAAWAVVYHSETDSDSVRVYPGGTIFHMELVESGFHKNRLRIHNGRVTKTTLSKVDNPYYGKRSTWEMVVQFAIFIICFVKGAKFAYNRTKKKFEDCRTNILGLPDKNGMKKRFVFNKQPYLFAIYLTVYIISGMIAAMAVSYIIGYFVDGLNLEFLFMFVCYNYGIWVICAVLFPLIIVLLIAILWLSFASMIIAYERFETYKYNRNMRCPNQECNAKTEPARYYDKQYPLPVPLHPGVYGIFHITHPITKTKLPTMISNGRLKLKRQCPHCKIMIDTDGNVIDKHMVFVGSPAAGKTTLMVRMLGSMIKQYPNTISIVGKIDSDIKDAVDSYVNEGIHKIVDKTYVAKQKRSILLRIERPTIPYQIYFNDVAGELFKATQATDNKLNFLANVLSIVLLVDPSTINYQNLDISDSFSEWINKHSSKNRIQKNDLGEVCDRLLNCISGDRFSRSNLQMNIVLVKSDLGYLGKNPEQCTQDDIRHFILEDMGLQMVAEFENRKEISNVSYFAVSAMNNDDNKSNVHSLTNKICEDLNVELKNWTISKQTPSNNKNFVPNKMSKERTNVRMSSNTDVQSHFSGVNDVYNFLTKHCNAPFLKVGATCADARLDKNEVERILKKEYKILLPDFKMSSSVWELATKIWDSVQESHLYDSYMLERNKNTQQ